MKVYIVVDSFNGTDCDSTMEVHSVWDDELVAKAVAESMYACYVRDYEVDSVLPLYAKEAYEKLLKKNAKTKKVN